MSKKNKNRGTAQDTPEVPVVEAPAIATDQPVVEAKAEVVTEAKEIPVTETKEIAKEIPVSETKEIPVTEPPVVEAKVEAPVVEAPVAEPVVEAPAAPVEPVVETSTEVPAPTAPTVIKIKVRYAPAHILHPDAVITAVAIPNPKRKDTESWRLYEQFTLKAVGMTVAQYEQSFVAANRTRERARRFLRWDYAHGHINLGMPEKVEVQPQAEAAE
jgi:hypothetical protein